MMQAIIDHTIPALNIRELQNLLLGLSHLNPALPRVAVTGVWNDQTENAVRAFQNQYHIPETGNVDLSTWNAITAAHEKGAARYRPGLQVRPLFNPVLITTPDSIPYFTELLQVMLRTIADISGFYPPVSVTGRYDEATASAIAMLQILTGLPTTGRLDLPTWEALAGMYDQEMRKLQSVPPIQNPNA